MATLNGGWDHLAETISIGIWYLQHPGNITNRRSSSHFTKCGDISYPLRSVLFYAVVDHLITTSILYVYIKVRHGYTIRIQESFKQQAIVDRI